MTIKRLLTFVLLFGFCQGLALQQTMATQALANDKVHQLRQKIADISLLQQQLQDRSLRAETILNELLVQRNEIGTEVRILVKSLSIRSLEQARGHHRVHYNIELLRLLIAYIDEFDTKVRIYRTGYDKLTYLNQLVNDDIRMVATLNDFQIDALTTQISLVINRYMPEAHTIKIDPRQVLRASAQSVWDGILKGKF